MTTSASRVRRDKDNATDLLGQRRPQGVRELPRGAQTICLTALTIAAEGGKADIAKPLKGLGAGVMEIALAYRGGGVRGADWRGVVGRARVPAEIDPRDQDPAARDRFDRDQGENG